MPDSPSSTDSLNGNIPPADLPDPDNEAQELLTRRRLLKLGAYVPPAIVGMAIISPGRADAHQPGHVGSCMPSACQPCVDADEDDDDNNQRNGVPFNTVRAQNRSATLYGGKVLQWERAIVI